MYAIYIIGSLYLKDLEDVKYKVFLTLEAVVKLLKSELSALQLHQKAICSPSMLYIVRLRFELARSALRRDKRRATAAKRIGVFFSVGLRLTGIKSPPRKVGSDCDTATDRREERRASA